MKTEKKPKKQTLILTYPRNLAPSEVVRRISEDHGVKVSLPHVTNVRNAERDAQKLRELERWARSIGKRRARPVIDTLANRIRHMF